MSRLDLLSQTMPRHVDAQSRNAFVNPDGQEGNGNGETADFGSLLDGISGKGSKDSMMASPQSLELLSADAGKANLESDDAEADPLQAFLPELSPSDSSASAPILLSGGSVFSILENLLPRVLASTDQGNGAGEGQSGASFASPNLSMPQQDIGELPPPSSGLGSKLAVSVQNQETHFRPIIEGLGSASIEQGEIQDQGADQPPDTPIGGKPKGAKVTNPQISKSDGLVQALANASAEAEAVQQAEDQDIVRAASPDRMPERAEAQKQSQAIGAKAESPVLPTSTLQQLAKSIVDDARSVSQPHQPSFQHDGLNRVATARASAGVLRVLDLQLRPAELGLLTIRMRLAGDSIEMGIQAQSENTAELLRNDAEKLSSLLRSSGYRPDIITIQSTDTTSHDRSSFQRSPQGDQSQSQSFGQGGASGNGSSSGHHDDRYARGSADIQKDGKESLPSGGVTGGVYL